MKTVLALALGIAVCGATAQVRPDANTLRSVSGQFVAHPNASGFTSRFYRGDASSIPLDPAVLVIAAERVKQSVWRQLDVKGPARGRIHLRIRQAHAAIEQPAIIVEPGLGQWNYKLDIPDAVTPVVLVRTLVHACLLEIANRKAQALPAELPLWLAEGISEELLVTERLEYLLPPPGSSENGMVLKRTLVNERRPNSFEHARFSLRRRPPLTFEQLSWPDREQLSEPHIQAFRASAHLFVLQLAQLPAGRACLQDTLGRLSNHLNWQFAFLDGFKRHFSSQLDVEKWWALQIVDFTGRDLAQTFTWEVSWEKLDQILHTPIEIRSSANEMPQRSEITLQDIVRDWDGFNQRTALIRKVQELDLLRPRVAQELIVVVDDYRELLGEYLSNQSFSGSFFGLRKRSGPIRNRLSELTIRELAELDARRIALKPPTEPNAVTSLSARAD